MGISFNMVGLFVKDLKRMVTFYRDVLGVEIEWGGEGPYAEFKHEGIRFAMYERDKLTELLGMTPSYPLSSDGSTDGAVNGTFELAIDLPSFKDVDVEFNRIVRGGGLPIYSPRDEPWGMRSSMIADPEGNLIEIG